jgi:flagellin
MSAQVRGMNVAVRNANDGISLAQTAEGALGQIGGALQRMRELAVQARNSTNSASDKDSLNKEFGELRKEISRVIAGTTFNGKAILGADATTMTFQVSASTGTNDTIAITLGNLAKSSPIAAVAGVAATSPSASDLSAANTAASAAATAYATTHGYSAWAATMVGLYAGASDAAGAAKGLVAAGLQAESQPPALANGIEAATSAAEVRSITTSNLVAGGIGLGSASSGATFYGYMAEAAYSAYAAVIPPAAAGASIGSGQDTAGLAQVINDLDAALAHVNDQRATFGATQARFDSVVANLQIAVENQSAARSRIMDADFATETANLSRAKIVQQAGTAMVAQANQLPQLVLALLN